MPHEDLLSVKNISKSFPGVQALNKVSLNVKNGEVIGLIGENGAGKSTLIKILAGVYQADDGDVFFDGDSVTINSPVDSQNLGISVIYQELNLLSNLSVAENLFVGREKVRFGVFYDEELTINEAKKLLARIGLRCDPLTLIKDLTPSEKQMVEIAKALSFDARLIIMDEPTSSLTDKEIDKLFSIINKLKNQNISVIFVSHKLDEILEIADRTHVLRDGTYIGCLNKEEISEDKLIQMMVGRNLYEDISHTNDYDSDVIFEVKNLTLGDFIQNVSFDVKKGEIVGFSGLMGSGRTEVMRAIFGVDQKISGDIYLDGVLVNIEDPNDAINLGIGFIPESGLFAS